MTDRTYFDLCRKRLWKLLKRVDFSSGCKSYEGMIEVTQIFPDFFESTESIPYAELVTITLYCYVLGDGRKHDFVGKTFFEAITKFDKWLAELEKEV